MPTYSLTIIAVAALINLWLSLRCGQVRAKEKISHGDGGNALLHRRMRAQLNFAENAPLILLLTLGLDMTGHGGPLLWTTGGAFLIARVLHGLGMDLDNANWMRGAGVGVTMLATLVLGGMALYYTWIFMHGGGVPSTIGRAA